MFLPVSIRMNLILTNSRTPEKTLAETNGSIFTLSKLISGCKDSKAWKQEYFLYTCISCEQSVELLFQDSPLKLH